MLISLCCPTRKRSKNMKRVWRSALDQAKNPDEIEMIYYIDNDDNESKEMYEKQLKSDRCKLIQGERIILSNMFNACWMAIESLKSCMYPAQSYTISTLGIEISGFNNRGEEST